MLQLNYLEDGFAEECLENRFHDREGQEESLVREHLAKTVEIVHFCMKQRHADGMGMPLVYAAATWLVEQGDALLRAQEQGWMALEGGEWFIMCDE